MGFGSGASGKEKTRRDTATVTTTCNEVVAPLAKLKVPMRAEPMREVRGEFSKRVADWAPDDVVGLALCLLSLAGWPNRLVRVADPQSPSDVGAQFGHRPASRKGHRQLGSGRYVLAVRFGPGLARRAD